MEKKLDWDGKTLVRDLLVKHDSATLYIEKFKVRLKRDEDAESWSKFMEVMLAPWFLSFHAAYDETKDLIYVFDDAPEASAEVM